MSLRELLDELLTSLETGPHITATRFFDAKPPVFAPFPSSLDPRIVESLKARGVQELYCHQAEAFAQFGRALPRTRCRGDCYRSPNGIIAFRCEQS